MKTAGSFITCRWRTSAFALANNPLFVTDVTCQAQITKLRVSFSCISFILCFSFLSFHRFLSLPPFLLWMRRGRRHKNTSLCGTLLRLSFSASFIHCTCLKGFHKIHLHIFAHACFGKPPLSFSETSLRRWCAVIDFWVTGRRTEETRRRGDTNKET